MTRPQARLLALAFAVAVQAAAPCARARPVGLGAIDFRPAPAGQPELSLRRMLDAPPAEPGTARFPRAPAQDLLSFAGKAGCEVTGRVDSQESPARPRAPAPPVGLLALAGLLVLAWRLRGHWGGGTAVALGLCLECRRALRRR